MPVRGEPIRTNHERWSVGTQDERLASGVIIWGVDALREAISAQGRRSLPDLELTLLRCHRDLASTFSEWMAGERELIIADEGAGVYVRLGRAWLKDERHHTSGEALQSHRLVINEAEICEDPLWDD